MSDAVNHPAHYTGSPSGVECIDVVEHMSFNLGNAVKYIWRAGAKTDDMLGDLQKARWYVDREIKRLSAPATAAPVAKRDRKGDVWVCDFGPLTEVLP